MERSVGLFLMKKVILVHQHYNTDAIWVVSGI